MRNWDWDGAGFYRFQIRLMAESVESPDPETTKGDPIKDHLLMVGAARFELTTPCTQNKCATRLRHAPTKAGLVEPRRLEKREMQAISEFILTCRKGEWLDLG